MLLAGTILADKLVDARPSESLAQPLESLDTSIAGWSSTDNPPLESKVLKELNPTSYISRTYRRGSESVDLFIAYYANQRAGESMHSPKHCLPGSGWEFLSYDKADVSMDGRLVRVNKDVIQKDDTHLAMLYWYQSRRRIIADEYMAKVLLVRDSIIAGRTGGAIVRIMFKDNPKTVDTGIDFASTILPRVQQCIGGESGAPQVAHR
jgi:EpsI family protein